MQLPFTMRPTGWFQVAWSADIPAGGVKPLKYFGKHLVAYRTEAGELTVLDAHCLHLGAHLGYGGKVCGDNIQCPYHGWEWDRHGVNAKIPYMSRPRPSQKRLTSWAVREEHEVVLVWHDPAGGPPRWEPPNVFTDLKGGECSRQEQFYPSYGQATQFFAAQPMHPQQSLENACDSMHFRYVHSAPVEPVLLEWSAGEHSWQSAIGFKSARTGEVVLTNTNLIDGVGLSYTSFTGRMEYRLLFATTPVDDTTCDLFLSFWVPRMPGDSGPSIPADRAELVAYLKSSLPDDLTIWVNQVYVDTPMYAEQDARPYSELRKWCTRFYEIPPEKTTIAS
jgi:3-ketosteroid 9alpha-monooxygenase subunit A